MSVWLWALGSCLYGMACAIMGFYMGRRREHAMWEAWVEREEAAKQAEVEAGIKAARAHVGRGITLNAVHFRRSNDQPQ